MKIQMLKRLGDYRDVVGWALVAAIVQATEKSTSPHMGIPKEFSPDENGELDVYFSVNGVEVPFEFLMERWEKEVQNHIHRKAQTLLEEKFSHITSVVYNLEEEVKRSARKLFSDEDWESDQ